MEISCKKYFHTIVENIRKKNFAFSIQNIPYSEKTNCKEKASDIRTDKKPHSNYPSDTQSDTMPGELILLTREFSDISKKQHSFLCFVDKNYNIYNKISLSDNIEQYHRENSLLSDKNNNAVSENIIFHYSSFYITWNQYLFIVNQKMEVDSIHTSPYLKNCPDMTISGDRLFMACSCFDAILVFDLKSLKFVEGYHIKHNKTANCIYLASFDPNSEKGPSSENALGITSIFIKDNRLYFSCANLDNLFYVKTDGSLHFSIPIPRCTTHIKPFKEGYLFHTKNSKNIGHISRDGKNLKSYILDHKPFTPKDPSSMNHSSKAACENPCLKNFLVRGNDLIVAAISPGALFVYEPGKPEPTTTMDISKKINGTIIGMGNIHHSL